MNIPLKQYWDLLATHIKSQRVQFAVLTCLLLGSIGLQIINPQIVRGFIDTASGDVESDTEVMPLLYAALAFIGIALVQQGIAVGATYMGENVAWTATNALRSELVRHCLRLDMSFHNETSPGELIERIDGDVTQLSTFFSQLTIRVVGNLLLLVGILIALAREDWRMSLAFTSFAALTLFVLNQVRSISVPYQKARRQASAELFGFLEEQLAGTEDVRSSGAVDFVLRGLYRLQYALFQHERNSSQMNWLIASISGLFLMLGNAIAFVAAYWLHHKGTITVGTVYLIIHYFNMLARPIRELTWQVESLQTVGASVERLTELKAVTPHLHDGPGAAIPAGPLSVQFEAVSFAYQADSYRADRNRGDRNRADRNRGDQPDSQDIDFSPDLSHSPNVPVLQDISFYLEPGKVLGLLGRTGSGKTTLARLLFRLYDPTIGHICLENVDLRTPTLDVLRRRVAMVTQDVQLFQASVRDNLTFFDATIPDTRVLEAIETLSLSDWYEALPAGLDTQIEAGGRSLSAGEAQLLAFTRVFLQNPGLVILDEASSRLDPATEQHIERAVNTLLKDRTAIIIAHRLATVERADKVLILADGRIIEFGARATLARDPASHFYHLLQTGLEEVLV
ncbi:MAG: ABC transporter ATP-binding protein [Anaerolineae bacterium]|nr:ABC transporter ATP-binding protein [Anaerolineae bacterium]